MSEVRPPVPPFTHETAVLKVRAAEDGWNSRNPEKVSLAYTLDSRWRNRNEIFSGRNAIVPGEPIAAGVAAVTRTGPMPATSSVTLWPSLAETGPEKRLHWPMKSATNFVRGKP